MIIDSSAIVAILDAEADGPTYFALLRSRSRRRMAAPTFVETALVMDNRRAGVPPERLAQFFEEQKIVVTDFTPEHAHLAREAYRRYGKGSGHPARLNFGDCLAYAAAKAGDEPLLFKGDEFTHTDVRDVRLEPAEE